MFGEDRFHVRRKVELGFGLVLMKSRYDLELIVNVERLQIETYSISIFLEGDLLMQR